MLPPIPGTDCPHDFMTTKAVPARAPRKIIAPEDKVALLDCIPDLEARVIGLEAGSIQYPLRFTQDLYSLYELLDAWGVPRKKWSSIEKDRKRQPNNGVADEMHGTDRYWNLGTAIKGPPGWLEGQAAVRREALRLILAGRRTGTPHQERRGA